MKVAIIIVNYNDAQNTQKYVKKIEKYEIINKIVIVDNMSTDSSNMTILNNLKNEKVDIVEAPRNGGYSYGNNYGVHYLENNNEYYDYIIISNPDIDIEENAIIKCINVLKENDNIAISAPRMYNSSGMPIRRSCWKKRTFGLDVIHSTRLLEILFYKFLRKGEYFEEEYKRELLDVFAVSGAFFIIRYEILKQINYFDENVFLFYEEDILGTKVEKLGYRTLCLGNEKFIHYESQTIGKTFSYYNKVKKLYKSKMYYQVNYNKINFIQRLIFVLLNICRKLELIVEIPMRKILRL